MYFMKTWKKIITFSIITLMSCVAFFACGKNDKYANMKVSLVSAVDYNGNAIENNTISLSGDTTKNKFTITVRVDGVKDDVSPNVEYFIDNPAIINFVNGTYSGNLTIGNFEAKTDGETIIRAKTKEGNKSFEMAIKVIVPIQSFVVKNNLVPIVRGTSVDLAESDAYLEYLPSNTTQREVYYKADLIADDDNSYNEVLQNEISDINKALEANPGIITIPEKSTITSFQLTITSKWDENKSQVTIVNVLDPITNTFCLEETTKHDIDGEEYSLLEYNADTKKYTLTLGLNNGEYFDYYHAVLEMKYLDSIFGGDIKSHQLIDETDTFYRYNDGNIEEFTTPKYSVSIVGLNGNIIDGNNLFNVTALGNYQFEFFKSTIGAEGETTVTFVIDYYSFEGMFKTVTLDLDVKLKMFPSNIFLFRNESVLKGVKNIEDAKTKQFKDNEIIAYKNGRMPVWVDVWSDTTSLLRQYLKVEVDNPNIRIENANGAEIDTIAGGEVFYIRQQGNAGVINSEVNLILSSLVYSKVTKTVKIEVIKEDTSVTQNNNIIYLLTSEYSSDQTSINRDLSLIHI